METKLLVEEIKEKMDSAGGLNKICFVACGGSLAALWPTYYMLKSEAKTFGVSLYTSNEFVHALSATINEQCICVICSLNATKETVEAVKVANGRGAITIAMTGSDETLMAQNGQYVVIYSNGDKQIYSQGNQAKALGIGFEILHQFEGYSKYKAAIDAIPMVDQIVKHAKEIIAPKAIEFAKNYMNEELFYVIGSGPLYSAAYGMSVCHLMEMQWKHAVTLHSGEYFHGSFETTDKDLPIILMLSEGRTRALDERCLIFLEKYADKVTILDMREMGINAIDSSVVEFFNSVVMVPVERFIVSKMAEIRNHSMDKRRYMFKVEY